MRCCLRNSVALSIALATTSTLAGRIARADTDEARAAETSLRQGQAFFDEGRYAEAIKELRRGYAINPQPRFLYSLGQAYRLNGRCTDAVRAYRTYLLTHPTSGQVDATEDNIRRCAAIDPASVAAQPEPQPPIAPATIAPTPAVALVVPPASPKKPVYKRWWLWTTVALVAGAGIGLGVGLGLGLHHDSASTFHPTLSPIGPSAPQ